MSREPYDPQQHQIEILERIAKSLEIIANAIEAKLIVEAVSAPLVCGQSFMGGATCILPEGHSSPHASGE